MFGKFVEFPEDCQENFVTDRPQKSRKRGRDRPDFFEKRGRADGNAILNVFFVGKLCEEEEEEKKQQQKKMKIKTKKKKKEQKQSPKKVRVRGPLDRKKGRGEKSVCFGFFGRQALRR